MRCISTFESTLNSSIVSYRTVLWKQPSFKQTSETVSAKWQITQIITQWVPGIRAGNGKCPMPMCLLSTVSGTSS